MVTISMPLPLFSTSSTYSEKNKNNLNISRHQARRISLPNTLNNQQRNGGGGGGGGLRSPRSRTPNSLSPKIGFLKEISEFDIDPPFISPGASSSSSADNSHCNSPMLLSPFSHRPSSARPYRRNKLNNNNQNLQLKSKIQDENDLNNKSIQRRNIQSMRAARRSEPFIFGNPEELANDDFKWTDVDGFYGRKNSIPLHQLLANDLTILKGIHAKNNEQTNDGNTPPCGTIKQLKLSQQQQQQFNDFSVNSDDNEIIENKEEINSSEDSLKIGKFKKRQKTQRNSLEEIKKSSSAPMSSPTKRRLKLIKNKLYSLEDDKKGIKIEIEEKDNNYLLEIENQEKIKINELLNEKEDNDDVLLLRQILKSKKQPIQQFRQFNVEQNGQRIIDKGVKTIRSKIYSQPTIRNPKARRATCPEIWLSEADNEEKLIIHCAVRLFGCNSVGKKSIAKKLALVAEVYPQDEGIVSTDCEDIQRPYQTVSFLLNEREINMQIIQGSLIPQNQKGYSDSSCEEFTIFAVVYSVDNRESFIRAAQILYRIYGDRKIAKREQKFGNKKKVKENTFLPLILIANKSDLQRKRRITSIEGKMLAKIYKCPFVEMSALLSANVDILWNEIIRKIYKYEQILDHFIMEKHEGINEINELNVRPPLVGRIMERTRRFAKSCEDWITTKIVSN